LSLEQAAPTPAPRRRRGRPPKRPRPRPQLEDRFLDREEAAHFLGLPVSALKNDVVDNSLGLPRHQFSPRRIQYRLSELQTWAAARRVVPGSQS
jgi:hypothetical protein